MGSNNSYDKVDITLPKSAPEDYKLWIKETAGTRSQPKVWIRDSSKMRGKYHYHHGCYGSNNDFYLNSYAIRQRSPCPSCYKYRPVPVVLNPPVYNSPEGERLGINKPNLISPEVAKQVGQLAYQLNETMIRMDEMSRVDKQLK